MLLLLLVLLLCCEQMYMFICVLCVVCLFVFLNIMIFFVDILRTTTDNKHLE